VNLLGRRPVLDQLEHVGPQHHRPGRDGEITAHLELRHVNARGQMRWAGHVAREASAASDEVRSAGVDAFFEHRGVRPREVRRRQRVEQVARRKPRLALGAPVEPRVGDQAVGGLAGSEVALHHPPQQPVVLPRPLAEPTIALARPSLGMPGRHPRQLDAEAPRIARGPSRMARQSCDRATGRPRLDEPAHAAALEHRIAQHDVEARPCCEPQTGLRGRDPVPRFCIRFHAHRTSRPWTISVLGVGIMPSKPWLMPSLR
jgi:hypothetical protein